MVQPSGSSSSRFIDGLAQVEGKDVLFCDVWGVLHNGVAPFAAACDALARFRAGGGSVVMVSNAPRPNGNIVAQFRQLGVPDTVWDAIVTSGDVARGLVTAQAGAPVYFIGPQRDLTLFAGLDAPFTAVGAASYCICTGLDDDETETAADYQGRLQALLARDLTMICANPDLVVERGPRLIPCAGAIALAYEEMGGKVIYSGKPWRPIYEMAAAVAAGLRGGPVAPARILAIGDAIRTDVAGAARFGIDVLLVLAGIHGGETLAGQGVAGQSGPDGAIDRDHVRTWLESQDFRPDFVMRALRW